LRNSTAVILTVVGGVFYVIGGALVALLAAALSSTFNGLSLTGLSGLTTTATTAPTVDTTGINDLIYAVGGFGIVTGIMIIVGGILLKSESPNRRKAGGILAVVMMFLGALPSLGGLLVGFILTAIGGYMGLTYKATRSNMVVGLGPVGSVTLGPPMRSGQVTADSPSDAGRGPLNYCIKCGSRLRDGAVFCGACGARVPE
jgi:hypothetical protein